MRNPGLSALAAPYIHPRMENIPRGDPDFDPEEEEGEGSDWVPFSGWRREPGVPLRTKVGPAFKPGETPEDVIHGEVVTPEEQDAADRIINGDHESDQPSDNSDVEGARQDLHTDAANDTVHTLSDLLKGNSPEDVGGLDEAHDYLRSRNFTGVKANPPKGILMAQGPGGMQIVRRSRNLPAVREEQQAAPTYTLTNKHGTFESHDAHRLVRAMVAFQLVNNQIALAQQQKQDDEDEKKREHHHAGLRDWIGDYLDSRRPAPVPSDAVFEKGRGIDKGPGGQLGGYVMPTWKAPTDWWHHQGTSYSRGHHMRLMLDPNEAIRPRRDPKFPDHTFTYAPSGPHQTPIDTGNLTIWVRDRVHPLSRGYTPNEEPAATLPKKGPTPPAHGQPLSLGHQPVDLTDFPDIEGLPPRTSAVNDLCPVCASGYLEPFDSQFHECLNCGSLVNHVGFEKEAASRPKGGLGRGLKNIETPEATKSQAIMDIAHGGTQDPNKADEPRPTAEYHPLRDEEMPEEYQEFEPRKRIVGAAEPEPITLDEHLGKFGFQPTHRAGDSRRAYVAPLPGTTGGYASLIERKPHPVTGEDRGWTLRAVHIPPDEQYTQHGAPYEKSSVPLDQHMVSGPKFNQPLTDLGERMMPQVSDLASGFHPVHDTALARAIADVGINGRDSQTYQDAVLSNPLPVYRPAIPGPGKSQRELRGLSSVDQMAFPVISNPGLTRLNRLAD